MSLAIQSIIYTLHKKQNNRVICFAIMHMIAIETWESPWRPVYSAKSHVCLLTGPILPEVDFNSITPAISPIYCSSLNSAPPWEPVFPYNAWSGVEFHLVSGNQYIHTAQINRLPQHLQDCRCVKVLIIFHWSHSSIWILQPTNLFSVLW